MSVAKKIINGVDDVVGEMLQGLLLTHPLLRKLDGHDVILRADVEQVKKSQVALISGGGSGHEPAHAGFVGDGMLTAAVCGGVFASPSVDSILAAILAVTGPMGCLLIVKNYTGDRLNFGLAAEMAKSKGLRVSLVVVADDYALVEKGITGRRGLAGTVLVHKIAGASAKAGNSLEHVTAAAFETANNVATMGVSLSNCNVPGNKIATRLMPDDGKMELGLGIHGEAGLETVNVMSANALVVRMMEVIKSRWKNNPSKVVVLLNNLGGTTAMELYVLAKVANELLQTAPFNLSIQRMYVAPVMTSLEMAGFSLTLLDVDSKAGESFITKLDAPTAAPGWPSAPFTSITAMPASIPAPETEEAMPKSGSMTEVQKAISAAVNRRIKSACDAVISGESKLTEWDKIVGDGDCGETFRRGATNMLKHVDALCTSPVAAFQVASQLARQMGGSSGAVLAIFFRACLLKCQENGLTKTEDFTSTKTMTWKDVLQSGNAAITKYGGASRGMRTMLDTLIGMEDGFAAIKSEVATQKDLNTLIDFASKAAEKTSEMSASAGRSSYLRDDITKGVPDPGAMALAFAIEGLLG